MSLQTSINMVPFGQGHFCTRITPRRFIFNRKIDLNSMNFGLSLNNILSVQFFWEKKSFLSDERRKNEIIRWNSKASKYFRKWSFKAILCDLASQDFRHSKSWNKRPIKTKAVHLKFRNVAFLAFNGKRTRVYEN